MVLLPVIVRDASDEQEPLYSFDVEREAVWEEGVEVRGVRTHSYLDVSCVLPTYSFEVLRVGCERELICCVGS